MVPPPHSLTAFGAFRAFALVAPPPQTLKIAPTPMYIGPTCTHFGHARISEFLNTLLGVWVWGHDLEFEGEGTCSRLYRTWTIFTFCH